MLYPYNNTLSWKICAKMSSILSQSGNVIDVSVHTQSIIVRSSNTNGHNIKLKTINMINIQIIIIFNYIKKTYSLNRIMLI